MAGGGSEFDFMENVDDPYGVPVPCRDCPYCSPLNLETLLSSDPSIFYVPMMPLKLLQARSDDDT